MKVTDNARARFERVERATIASALERHWLAETLIKRDEHLPLVERRAACRAGRS